MKDWKRLPFTLKSQVGYARIVTKFFELPSGTQHDFATIGPEQSNAAAILALTPDNQVLISRQFRPGPEMVMDELPGGGVDEGEDLEVAARRELMEETGYQAGTMEYLGVMHYDAYSNLNRHCFMATSCTPAAGGATPEDTEAIELITISIEQLLQNAKDGLLTDPGVVLLAYDRLQKLKKENAS